MHICKTLDNNPKVKKYENLNGYHYAINVLLSNEQAGRIYIDNYTSRGIKPEEEFNPMFKIMTEEEAAEYTKNSKKVRININFEIDFKIKPHLWFKVFLNLFGK